ncbi:MAG TPA: MFS transporter [Trebonia sp.]|nr:MFS transporter [Trebonia sp.]
MSRAPGTLPAQRASFRDVFAVAEFRALWASQVLSLGGDRLALVALTLLVYDRTRSPLLAAIAFAAGTLPYIVGALFLSSLADRFPRRTVMVVADVARMLLVAAMLVPGMSLDALIVLLYAVTTIQPVFDSAKVAIVRDVVTGERYVLSVAVVQTTQRVMIVAGAGLGGLIVALVGARSALGIDAVTFAASGLIVGLALRSRPAADQSDDKHNPLVNLVQGTRLVFGDKALRTVMLLGWLAAFYELPSALAAPYASKLGGGPVAAGLLIASTQIGSVVAMPYFTKRVGPLTRLRWMGPMAVCTCLVLVTTVLRPSLAVSMAIFAVANMFTVYQIAANTAFVERVPNERRGQAFALANAGLIVGQGAGFAIAGAVAEVVPPSTVVALAGGLGAVVACGLALTWRQMQPVVGRHSARHLGREASVTRQEPVQMVRVRG